MAQFEFCQYQEEAAFPALCCANTIPCAGTVDLVYPVLQSIGIVDLSLWHSVQCCALPIPFPVAQFTTVAECSTGKGPGTVPAPTVARVPGPQRLSGSSCQSAGQHYSVSHEEARNAATHCSASEPAKPAALCSVELRTSRREEAVLRSWSWRAFTFKTFHNCNIR